MHSPLSDEPSGQLPHSPHCAGGSPWKFELGPANGVPGPFFQQSKKAARRRALMTKAAA